MSRYQRSMRDALQSVADSQMEFDEAVKWEVKITGLPTFYADGKSKGEVKTMLRKLLKRPDEIVSIERTTPAELKKIRRAQIQGNEPSDDEEEDVTEELLVEDNRIIKVKNKELTNDDIINMIQFGHPFNVVDEDIPPQLPGPEVPRYKNVSNAVVDKADKKSNKAMAKAEKDTLVPTQTKEAADTWHPDPEEDKKSTSYKHHVKRVPVTPQRVDRFSTVKVTADQLRKIKKEELGNLWLEASEWAKAQEKDKKNQNKDPVGKQHEGIVSGAGKVAGAAIGGAAGLAFGRGIGLGTGAAIIKGTDALQKKLDKKKAERERVKAAGEGRQKEEVEINDAYNSILDKEMARRLGRPQIPQPDEKPKSDEKWKQNFDTQSAKRRRDSARRQQAQQHSPGQRVEVAPPGWGHTKAEYEKTKPNKPKSKIGGTAHEFDKDLKSGKFKGLPGDKTAKDKKASMFKIMWSQHNKGDKPHYKPGVKDKLKTKYKKDESVLDSAKKYLVR